MNFEKSTHEFMTILCTIVFSKCVQSFKCLRSD